MQWASSRIWTRVAVSISCKDNHYTTGRKESRKGAYVINPIKHNEKWYDGEKNIL